MSFVYRRPQRPIAFSLQDGEREALDALDALAANTYEDDQATLVMRPGMKRMTPPKARQTTESKLPSVMVAEPYVPTPASEQRTQLVRVVTARRPRPNASLWLLAVVVAFFAVKGAPLLGVAVDNAFGAFENARTSAR